MIYKFGVLKYETLPVTETLKAGLAADVTFDSDWQIPKSYRMPNPQPSSKNNEKKTAMSP